MDDNKIIQLLREGKRDKAFLKLYKGYPAVEKLIKSKGGLKHEAEDVFQEALIIFYNKALDPKFKLSASISTYVYSVSRFLWKDELIKKGKYRSVDADLELSTEESDELVSALEKESNFKKLEEVLEKIGAKCLQILTLFYHRQLSMKEIAKKIDLRSEKVAKNQKYKCLERAKLKLIELQNQHH